MLDGFGSGTFLPCNITLFFARTALSYAMICRNKYVFKLGKIPHD